MKNTILLIDSDHNLASTLDAITLVNTLEDAHQFIRQYGQPVLVLLNLPFPSESDFAFCKTLKAPFIIISTEVEAALATGAVDCLSHPAHPALLKQRIEHHLEMQRLQHSLKQHEERYQVLRSVASEYFYELHVTQDQNFIMEGITDAMQAISGYSEEELLKAGWPLIVHPDDRELLEARFQALLDGLSDISKFRIITKEGEIRWLKDYAHPAWDEDGGCIRRIYGMGRDITLDHETELALQHSQQTLNLALEASGAGIWDWDMVSGKAYFSPEWLAMIGYKLGEVEENFEGWRSLIHPDDFPQVQIALQDHITNDTLYEVEHRLKTKAGEWRWVMTRGKVVNRDSDGTPLRMVGTHRDIQHARMMQSALTLSEERYRIISNTISDYAYSYKVNDDNTLSKEWSTQAFHDITGYTFEEMDKDGWQRMTHPDDMDSAQQRFINLMQGNVDVTEFRIVTKEGEIRWLRDHGYPVIDEKTGKVIHIYGAAQDITQRKRFEEALQQQALELKERNEELDAFAYTVAHDLKNPISSMMGFASLMQNYYDRMSPERVQEYLSLIMEGGYKLKSIINALLLLSGVNKIEQADVEILDMKIIVEDTKKRLNSMIEEYSAKVVIQDDWPEACGYGPWVEEVWMNYMSNALKYGGTPPLIELGAKRDNGMVRFWVRDNGKGLTPEEQQRVFTPFTRLNQVKIEGHGLGLSVVQRIVHKLGGNCGVESRPGEGSTFSFTLPTKV